MNQTESVRPQSGGLSLSSQDDPRLVEAMREYLAALEARQKPSRSEFLACHAEIANPLAECLDGLDFVYSAAPELSRAGTDRTAPSEDIDTGRPLGDFQIIREIGRGGMGVVYEAKQLSLGRRVALKLLPFAATLDARQLQRFKNEAQAAACLHHTNIVPVYYVGCERGVHFYAMQLIDGQTLAQVIAALQGEKSPKPSSANQSPADVPTGPDAPTVPLAALTTERSARSPAFFRTVAQLSIQAAEALEHAHQLGVIHRDIKPGNLLVDGRGHVWLTDFGLAHCQSQAGLTMSGDLVGTLRYMSPEQALAKRVVVDQRTDVYSLGATLYELLTLEPAFTRQDRQELLRQIAFEEPKAPRRVNRAIPAELETIVLKAMEKNPTDRYVTCQELAEDLQRYLKDEPIRARRPTLVHQALKWARRHQPVAWSAAAALLAVLTVVAGSVGWVARDRSSRLEETRRVVDQALDESASWQRQRRLPEALSAARRAHGLVTGGTADEELRRRVQARVADLTLLDDLENARSEASFVEDGQPALGWAEELRRRAFAKFGLDIERLPPEEAGKRLRQSTVAVELAAALDHWAMTWLIPRPKGRADTDWKHLLLVARATDPDPVRGRLREALCESNWKVLTNLAVSDARSQLSPAAVSALGEILYVRGAVQQARALLRDAQQRCPEDFWVNYVLGGALDIPQPRRREEAIGFYRAAVVLRPHSPLARVNLGIALADRDPDGAIAECRTAIRLQPDFWVAHNSLGAALQAKGRLDEAIAEYREAVRLAPNCPRVHNNLGDALAAKGMLAEAIAAFRVPLKLAPNSAAAHNQLVWVLAVCPDAKLRNPAEAVRLAMRAVELAPRQGAFWNTLGVAHYRGGDWKAAVADLQQSMDLQKGGDAADFFFLAMAHWQLGDKKQARAWYDKAIVWMNEYISDHEDLKRFRAEAADLLGITEAAKP